MSRGFKALSKARRKQISTAAGKKSQQMGVAHSYDSIEASKAAVKSVLIRKRRAALKAAQRLLEVGFTPEQLSSVNLSYDEFMWYGGLSAPAKRLIELAQRIVEIEG